MNIVLDLEVIPSDSEYALREHADYCETKIAPPGNYKKQETIDKWYEENGAALREKHRHSQGLDASTGRIISLGYQIDDGPAKVISADNTLLEYDILQRFFDSLDVELHRTKGRPMFIGHNLINFDLPYIWRRAKILGVPIPPYIPSPAELKPWSESVFDTMIQWAGPRDRISLDRLCRIFGIEGKDGMDGADVWDYYKDGKQQEIDAYCASDVAKTYELWRKLR